MYIDNIPYVSVIVPIYNAEVTLNKCIDSLLNQSLSNIEIILVDDGSLDSSPNICDDYSNNDLRVKVIHQNNAGVSAARQAGIDRAIGEYTIHADPDDWVEPTALEELYEKAKEDDADMVICDFYEDTVNGKILYHKQEPTNLHHQTILSDLFKHLHGSCCNKLIKKKCYKKYNVKFPFELHYCEDLYVISSILLNEIKVSYLNKAFYHYVQYDKTTLVKKYTDKTYLHDIEMQRLFSNLFKENEIKDRVISKLSYNITCRAFYYGGNFFDSLTFKKCFSQYIKIILNGKKTMDICLIVPSCFGFYNICQYLYTSLKRIKYCYRLYNKKNHYCPVKI